MKRKSCELCKHPYTFAPVYKDGMPERLPWTVVIGGLVKHFLWQTTRLCRVILVSSLWLVAVPWLTTQSLHYYGMIGSLAADDSPAWHAFLLDCFVGLAVSGATFLLFLSLMLLRELLLAEREQERARNELQWRDDPRSMAEEEPFDESDWHAGVPSREYRAWLRRRQLLRERQALEEGRRQREEEDLRRASIFSANQEVDDDTVSQRSSLSIVTNTTTMRLRRTSAVTAAAATGSPASTRTATGGRPSIAQAMESIRCRHCNSRFCVSREHLLLTRNPDVPIRRRLPILNVPPPPDPDQPLRVGEDDLPGLFAIGISLNPDPDQADLTFARFLGLSCSTSPFMILQSLSLLLMANWLLLHTCIIVPVLVGGLPLTQLGLEYTRKWPLCNALLRKLVRLWSPPPLASLLLQGYSVMLVAGGVLVRCLPTSSWVSRWLRFTGAMAKVIFFLVGHELLLAPFLVGRMAAPGLPLHLTWALGLGLLTLVSESLLALRLSLRTGLFHWLRHPHDPASHPLRIVVLRPVGILMVRMVSSLLLQMATMAVVLKTGQLAFGFSGLDALQVSFSWESMMTWPTAILCALVALRVGYWLIQQVGSDLRQAFIWALRSLARPLRLSSVLFGGRWPAEEVFPRSGTWQWSPSEDRQYQAAEWERAASMAVEPLDVAKTHSRIPGFLVTFRPHFYHLRIALIASFGLACLFVAHLTSWCLAMAIGRKFMPTSDLISLFAGLGCICAVLKGTRLIAQQPLNRMAWILFKGPVAFLQLGLFLSFPLIIWPCLTGLYVYSLISPLLCRWDQTPIIAPISAWAIGLPIVKVAWSLRQHWVRSDRNALLDSLSDPWRIPFWPVCRHLLWPVTAKLGGLLLIPPLAAILVSPLLGLNPSEMLLLQRCSHALVLLLPLTALFMTLLLHLHKTLVTRIREDTYLIGRQLVNLEAEEEEEDVEIPLRRHVNNLEVK